MHIPAKSGESPRPRPTRTRLERRPSIAASSPPESEDDIILQKIKGSTEHVRQVTAELTAFNRSWRRVSPPSGEHPQRG